MTEVARADYEYDETEYQLLLSLISQHCSIDADSAAELANKASEKAEDVVSLQKFTRQLTESLNERERESVVLLLWKIAFAHGRRDKYEDHLIMRIADLLYVSRSRVMKLKHDVSPQVED